MTPLHVSYVDFIRDRWRIAIIAALASVALACGEKSALPTAPSETDSPALSIEGVVRERADGQAVSGARIEIAQGPRQGLQAAADADGRYRLNDLAPGTFVLRAVADGYTAAEQSVTLSANQTIDFSLDPSSAVPSSPPPPPPHVDTFTLSGSIVDGRNEAPVRGARVRVVDGPDRGAETEADSRGRYQLTVQAGASTLEASAASFATARRSLTVAANAVVDFELDATGDPAPPSGPVIRGQVVDGVSNASISGATIRADGGGQATSGGDGSFALPATAADRLLEITIASASTVERSTRVSVSGDVPTLTLIPRSIGLRAFDQMFRGDGGVLRRWTTAPAVVVQRRVLQFTDAGAGSFAATATTLTDEEIDAIVGDLSDAMADLTGGTFGGFASRQVETAAEGESVSVSRPGVVYVAEYEGLTAATSFWGYTRWAWNDRGEVRAASMMLDRSFETSSSPHRRSLHAHELGHALGYYHVDAGVSVMNSSGRVAPTDFDRHGARLAFQRRPLNMTPDVDPDPVTVSRAPASGLTWTGDH